MRALDHIGSAFLRVIVKRMKDLVLSQTALAKRMHVSRPYITKLLQSDVNISFRTAAKLAKALEMDFMPVLKLKDKEIDVEDHAKFIKAESGVDA